MSSFCTYPKKNVESACSLNFYDTFLWISTRFFNFNKIFMDYNKILKILEHFVKFKDENWFFYQNLETKIYNILPNIILYIMMILTMYII